MAGQFRRWLRPPYATAVGNLRLMFVPLVLTVSGTFAFIDEDDRAPWAVERLICVAVVLAGALTGALRARHQRRRVRSRKTEQEQQLEDLAAPWPTLLLPDLVAWVGVLAVYLVLGRWPWTFLVAAFAGAHLLFVPVARMAFYPDERRWRRTEGQKAAATTPNGTSSQRRRQPRARR